MANTALAGIRVLDLSRILAGPWASQMLADLGAEVIKVERPGLGDDTRRWGPPFLKDSQGHTTSESAYFHCTNRNKQSIGIDITHPEGQAVIRELAARADVLIENFKVGGLKKYGLDYTSLRELNPALVYCSITGFGQNGPYAARAGYDAMIQGEGGLMSLTGEPGGEPMKVGVALVDVMTGLYACNAIQAALLARQHTGAGQHIDMALLDVQVAALANQGMNYLATGDNPQRLGNGHPSIVPYQVFATSDGSLMLAVGNDQQFGRFCELAGHPEWLADPRFATNSGRVSHRQALIPLLAAAIAGQSTQWWIRGLEARQVPCGPVNTLAQVFDHPQVHHRQTRVSLPHSVAGQVPGIASPMKLSATPVRYHSASPTLGQHTGQILTKVLEMSDERIDRLRAAGVIEGE